MRPERHDARRVGWAGRMGRGLLVLAAAAAGVAALAVLLTQPAGLELGTLWHQSAGASLNLAQAVVQRYLHPALWTDVLVPVLMQPAAAVFGVIALLAVAWLVALRLWRGP